MPRNLSQYTQCAAPGVAHEFTTAGNIALEILAGLIWGAIGGKVYAFVISLLGAVASVGCAIGVGLGALLIAALISFKYWYYNERLMCIKDDQCVAGTIVGEPHDATDGDRKLDIHIVPFRVKETEQKLIEKLDEMRAELPSVPDLMSLQNRPTLEGYVRGLSVADQKKIYIKLVDEKLFTNAGNSFLKHYFKRIESIMGTAAFNNSPDDTLAASDPNPMFRYSHSEGDDPNENVLVPWMHCEVEGNRLGRWLDNVLVGFIAGLATYTAICVICDAFTAGTLDFLCGWVGAGVSALIAFLAWLISHLFNDPDDGVAGSVDVDVEDPDFSSPTSTMKTGDVVYIFGNWVMDTEHDKYMEIHPVKAYYLLCSNERSPDDWGLNEDIPASECEFDPSLITASDMERMCKMVQSAEKTDPKEDYTIERKEAASKIR